jgi:hypothetical protein
VEEGISWLSIDGLAEQHHRSRRLTLLVGKAAQKVQRRGVASVAVQDLVQDLLCFTHSPTLQMLLGQGKRFRAGGHSNLHDEGNISVEARRLLNGSLDGISAH